MRDAPRRRVRLLVDYERSSDITQIGYEVWDGAELTGTGTAPVGPFEDWPLIVEWVKEHTGVQLKLW